MSRRFDGNMNGERYCGDKKSMEIHDLDQETCMCHIDDVIAKHRDRPFLRITEARKQGYNNCEWCLD